MTIEQRLARARELEMRGTRSDALRAYLEILRDDLTNYEALTRLGVLYVNDGNLPNAHVVFAEAVRQHPARSTPHAYLANVLLDLGDVDGAVAAYEAALVVDPHDRIAHRGLAIVHERAGRIPAADAAWRKGFPDGVLASAAFRGTGEPVAVLLVTSAVGGNIPLYEILDDRVFAVTTLVAESYADDIILPTGSVAFNAIGDADRCGRALDRAERALRRISAAIINPPARVRASGRASNAERFRALDGVVAPRVAAFTRADLAASDAKQKLAARGFGFPLLLRSPGYHTGQHFARIEDPGILADAVAELPGDPILAIEYVDTRHVDGTFRKYRVMFVDGGLYPLHLAISRDWKVHYFSAAMAEDEAYRAEERAFLTDPRGALGEPVWSALERVAATLNLDYGGADFAVDRNGRLVVFEANATMVILPPGDEPHWDYRRAPIEAVREAVTAMVVRRAERVDARP